MSGLPRVVLKWLQAFDLSLPLNNPKWDLSNGYLIAEILSAYYPKDIQMFCFNNGNSLKSKLLNWALIKKLCLQRNLDIPVELMDAAMHCKEGGGILLMEELYRVLTKKRLQLPTARYEIDFTDWAYQQQLPYHARSTAAKSVKNNMKTTEFDTEPNINDSKYKASRIIDTYFKHSREDRENFPKRFDRKPTIAELCLRRPLPIEREDTRNSFTNFDNDFDYKTFKPISKNSERQMKSSTVHLPVPVQEQQEDKNYKEITVRQESYAQNLGVVN